MDPASAGIRRSRLHGLGRRYGPGQLGYRSRRWRTVRLYAAVGDPAVERDGDPAAGTGRAARYRDRSRSRAGVPRQFLETRQHSAVAGLRGRDHCLRSCGSHRHGDRAAIAVRYPTDRRRADHCARCLPVAAADEQGLPLSRSLCHCAADRHRDLFRGADRRCCAARCGRVARFPAVKGNRHQSGDALHRDRHHRRDGDAA